MEKYKIIKNIGDGSFGTVKKALIKGTKTLVAIKKLKHKFETWEECSSIPEISILRKLHHPNIIQIKEIIRESNTLYLVFDYLESSLIDFILISPSSIPTISSYIRQFLEGLAYIHRAGFMHRDIKPENILVSGETCKIIDFGIAKRIGSSASTEYISTRWYRAPELLLHSRTYTAAIDLYALGCIIAEMLIKRPLFPGNSEKDQLEKITQILGTPIMWPEGKELAKRCGHSFSQCPGVSFAQLIDGPAEAISLVEGLVKWDPNERLTASQALSHPFVALNPARAKKKLRILPEENLSKNSKAFYRKHVTDFK